MRRRAAVVSPQADLHSGASARRVVCLRRAGARLRVVSTPGEVMHVQMLHAIKRNITFTSELVAHWTLLLISPRF